MPGFMELTQAGQLHYSNGPMARWPDGPMASVAGRA
jgi:hypothetical protein